MSAGAQAPRDFENFLLGDDVYKLAGGVVPEVAERLDFTLSAEPNSQELFGLVGALGKNKVLRDNEEVTAIDRAAAASLVERSGIQRPLDRSLWTPDIPASGNADAYVATGAVANWQDRVARLLLDGETKVIYLAAGNRVMDTATERSNPYVQQVRRFYNDYRFPTESQYGRRVITPLLEGYDHTVVGSRYNTTNGDVLAGRFFDRFPELLDRRLAFARVANAGVQLGVQMRKAAQARSSSFDTDPANPQVFVVTDSFPLSLSEAHDASPVHFQKAHTALRQLVLTAKMLHEAAGGE